MEKNNKIQQGDWEMLAKYLAGEATDLEKSIFQEWVNKDDFNKQEFEKAKKIFDKTGVYYNLTRFDKQKGFMAVNSKINQSKPQSEITKTKKASIIPLLIKYAAIAIVVLSVGSFTYFLINSNISKLWQRQIVSTENVFPDHITLPDGSVVALNQKTRLKYPEKFLGNSREVEIIGEAFFNVTPDPEKPFIIKAGETRIKVLGTSFNVNAYPESQTIEVVVETGIVQVSNISELGDEVFLDPGFKATFSKKNKKLSKNKNDDPNYNSWNTYSLKFNDSKLSYVLETLEKTYHVTIDTEDPEIENLVLKAQFENKSIDFVLEVIRLTFNLELLVDNNHYILKHSQV